jgi:hypothetical protein
MTFWLLAKHPPKPQFERPTVGEIGPLLHVSYHLAMAMRTSNDLAWIASMVHAYGQHLTARERHLLLQRFAQTMEPPP